MIHGKSEHSFFEVEKIKNRRSLTTSSINLLEKKGSLLQIAKNFGLKFNKNNLCRCPFHMENTSSLKIFKGYNRYYCHGCGATGNILKFVQKYTGKKQIEAAFYIKQVCCIREKLVFSNTYIEVESISNTIKYVECFSLKAKKVLKN